MDWLLEGLSRLFWFAPYIASVGLTTAAVVRWRHEVLRWSVPALVTVLAVALWPALSHEVVLPPAIAGAAALMTQAVRRGRPALRAERATVE